MGSCHIAHDCKIGDRNIFANNTLLAGHVVVEVRFSLCLYSKPGFSSVVSFGLCGECRTIHTQQEPRWSTSSVILALLLSLAVVLWYIFLKHLSNAQHFQRVLTGTVIYRFHKMFQST